ncbi:rRNA methyltransferase 3, mitochondrial isoform X2 [Andrena cerasifolii]|uniref:rRNA methyltransferase 3, mitochondrial isoform X2 n=1 Tax=Andrena cerasifolii TaxID=2819439 RepID=UPI004037D337
MVFFKIMLNTLQPLGRLTNFQTVGLKVNATRTYVRWVSRRPAAIVNEDELYETDDTTTMGGMFGHKKESSPRRPKETSPRRPKESSPRKPRETFPRKPKEKELSSANSLPKQTGETKTSRFTVLEHNDKIVTSLMVRVKSRKRREKNDEIILEGRRQIKEGLDAGAILETILFNNPSDIDTLNIPSEAKLYKVPYRTIQLWSSLTNSPGLIGIFKTPDVHTKEPANDALPLTIICDNVREPGNLGSIMRAAAGVGCEKLILMKGCVDLWDPKVLRSAAGAHFRMPIHTFPGWNDIPSLISEDSHIFVTDSNFGDQFISEYTPEELRASMGVFNADPETFTAISTANNNDATTKESNQRAAPTNKKMMKNFLLKLPILPYYALDYTKKEIVLVLGGETEGLSLDSHEFLNKRKGIRINIPLLNGVDSLNTGVALGIVTFEMKRQFIKRQSEL